MIIKNSELIIYDEENLGSPFQKMYRDKDKIIFEYKGDIIHSTRIYDVSRVSNVPVAGVSAHDFTAFVITSPSDDYIIISNNRNKDKSYLYAERIVSIFSRRERIARIHIQVVKDLGGQLLEYSRKYEYSDSPSLKLEVEKYAEGKYDLHITYVNGKIDNIERKGR